MIRELYARLVVIIGIIALNESAWCKDFRTYDETIDNETTYIHYYSFDDDTEPEFSFPVSVGGKALNYFPHKECDFKRFMGWSTTKLTNRQQTAPDLVNIPTTTFSSSTKLYAVYATPNRGNSNTAYLRNIIEVSPKEMIGNDPDTPTAYSGKYATYNVENVDRKDRGLQTHTKTMNISGVSYPQYATITTDRKINDLRDVTIEFYETSTMVTLTILISEDGENWVKKGSTATNTTTSKPVLFTATLEKCGDYYVRIRASSSTKDERTVDISRIQFNCENRYWYSDYATNCTTAIPIPIEVTHWTENGLSFTSSVPIPDYDEFKIKVNDNSSVIATCSQVYDRYSVIGLTDFDTQQFIQLQWYKKGQLVATGAVVSPVRVNGDVNLSSLITEGVNAPDLNVVVASGTLTVDSKTTIQNLDIHAGATVAILNDTLTVASLSFHGGLEDTDNGGSYDVPRLYIQKEGCASAPGDVKHNQLVRYYLNVNSDHYYPFSVPFSTSVSAIRYVSRPNTDITPIVGDAIVISSYDGEARGNEEATDTKYWSDLSSNDDLIPGVGYIISAKKLKGETYASLCIPMMVDDINATTDAVHVGAWGVGQETTTAWYNQGWNYIANPYTAMIAGYVDETQHTIQSGTDIRFATIPTPTLDGYDQVPIAEAQLRPFYGFFIQVGTEGQYDFRSTSPYSAPVGMLANENTEQEVYITLAGEGNEDYLGLIIGPEHHDGYEINADLSKELGDANDLRAWLVMNDTKMAYLAVNDETARNRLPIEIRTPAEGDYTFYIRESSRAEDLEGLYLHDNTNQTITNLLDRAYTFTAPAGVLTNRFTIRVERRAIATTVMGREVEGQIGGEIERRRVFKDGHIFICVHGVTYNAEGKAISQ